MYGYGRCLQRGKSNKTSKNGHVHVFPYQASNPTWPQRTQNLVAEHSREALDCGSAVDSDTLSSSSSITVSSIYPPHRMQCTQSLLYPFIG